MQMQTPRISDSQYDSNQGSDMNVFLKDMITQMRTDYIESSEDEMQEADPSEEQEYDEEYSEEQQQYELGSENTE